MIGTAKERSRWSRLRLVASWLVWLATYLFAFRADPSVLPLILICFAFSLRPPPLKETTDRQRLGGAIAALITFPLIAVLLGSESALAFLRTVPGMVVLAAIWASSVIADIRFYRSLPAFSIKSHASSQSSSNVA